MSSEEELFGTFEMFDAEKEKRRFINSLIQGSAKKGHYLYHMIPEKTKCYKSGFIGFIWCYDVS